MNKAEDWAPAREGSIGSIRRRQVIYVAGYDPLGAKGYFDLFRRTCDRFQRLWPLSATLQSLESDSADFAHWRLNVRGARWQVATDYDFLRLEKFISSDIARPTASQVLGGLRWFLGDLLSGAEFRIFRASWRFGLHLLHFQLLLCAWVAVPAIIALLVADTVSDRFGSSHVGVVASFIAPLVCVLSLRPIAERWGVIQIASCWMILRRFARNRPTWLDYVIDAGARRLIAVAQENQADEVAIVGHSFGCVIAQAIVARALEIDPDLGHRGPRLVLLTLGSVMPAVALHPAARKMKDIVSRLAAAPTVAWIDCQSRKDIMSFANFDPVGGIGVPLATQRRSPLLWQIRFREMISPEKYSRFRWSHLRVHYQYIMAGDLPAPYDYILLVGGPTAIAEWPTRHRQQRDAFIKDGISGGAHCSPEVAAGACP